MKEQEITELSDKGLILYSTMIKLEAFDAESAVNSVTIGNLIEEDEDLMYYPLTEEIDENEFMNIILSFSPRSINTTIASLVRKGLVGKSEPKTIKIDGERRSLRFYHLIDCPEVYKDLENKI